MKYALSFIVVMVLAACSSSAQYASQPNDPQKLSDETLCLSYAEKMTAELGREISARNLTCANLTEPDVNHTLPNPYWHDEIDAATRGVTAH